MCGRGVRALGMAPGMSSCGVLVLSMRSCPIHCCWYVHITSVCRHLLKQHTHPLHLLVAAGAVRVCSRLLLMQAFAGGEGEAGDDTLVSQLRYKRNMLGDLIAAKDVQVSRMGTSLKGVSSERRVSQAGKWEVAAVRCFAPPSPLRSSPPPPGGAPGSRAPKAAWVLRQCQQSHIMVQACTHHQRSAAPAAALCCC
jgi:hypothetical protein